MDINNICVYCHITKDTNEIFYIGIGSKKRAYVTYQRNIFWKNIVNKHDYKIEILHENLDWNLACEIETHLIKFYGRRDLGLGSLVNLTDGGEGTIGIIRKEITKEIRKKLSDSKIGFKHSEATKLKISKIQIGKKLSKYTCEKMSNSRKGKSRTIETKLKISQNNYNNKKVIDINTNIIYNSIIEASEKLNINYVTLKRYLSGKRLNKTTLKYFNYE